MLFILLIILSVIAGYSLDCREGPMKKNSLSVCLFVGLCQGQTSKVKRTLALELLKTLLYMVETRVAGAENVWAGGGGWVGGSPPRKIEIFFFFRKSLYLVKTNVAGAKNVWRGG